MPNSNRNENALRTRPIGSIFKRNRIDLDKIVLNIEGAKLWHLYSNSFVA